MRKPRAVIVAEQWVSFGWTRIIGIRSTWRNWGTKFWPQPHPPTEGTVVNYQYCRQLYNNSGENGLGAGFAKPIIDLQVQFMGMPIASTDSDTTNEFLNDCLHVYWTDEIQQMFRDAIRDSKTILRVRRPDVIDPLMTLDEADHGEVEVIVPERVEIIRNPANRKIIDQAIIHHRVLVVIKEGDPAMGTEPVTNEHEIWEVIDRQSYKFYDKTTSEELTDLSAENKYGFVPILEVDNEWDSAFQGGRSDLETVIPFLDAFHDVLAQALQAHKYHSTPKVKVKLTSSVEQFIKNNFPEAIDPNTGAIADNAEISWKGREILFMQGEDDVTFLEARDVLGNSKVLADFLIDCICIASQTPEWAFMRVDAGSANSDRNAQTVPFVRKIERKRKAFERYVQDLLKMILVMNDKIPIRPKLSWEIVRADDQMIQNQAFQMLVMGLEVARQRGEISDETYQRMLRQYLPVMQAPAKESAAIPPVPTTAALPAAPQPNQTVVQPSQPS